LVQRDAAVAQRRRHGEACAETLWMRRRHVIRVGRRADGQQLGVNASATLLGVLERLQYERGGALTHDEPVAVFVERPTRHLRTVISRRHRAHGAEPANAELADHRLAPTAQDDVGITGANGGQPIANVVIPSRARRHDAMVRPGEPMANGNDSSGHIRDHHRHKERRQAIGPVLLPLDRLRLERLDTANTTAKDHADARLGLSRQPSGVDSGITQGLVTGDNRVLTEWIESLRELAIQKFERIEPFDIAREPCVERRRIEPRNRTGAALTTQGRGPKFADRIANRRERAHASDDNPLLHRHKCRGVARGARSPLRKAWSTSTRYASFIRYAFTAFTAFTAHPLLSNVEPMYAGQRGLARDDGWAPHDTTRGPARVGPATELA